MSSAYLRLLIFLLVKNLLAMQETWVWPLGWEQPLEKGMAIHSSILAWRIPWTEEPGGLQSMGSQRVGHDWSDWHFHYVTEGRGLRQCFYSMKISIRNPPSYLYWCMVFHPKGPPRPGNLREQICIFAPESWNHSLVKIRNRICCLWKIEGPSSPLCFPQVPDQGARVLAESALVLLPTWRQL